MEMTRIGIDESEARDLLASPDLIAIGGRADAARRQRHGARTTFVRVFEIHVDAPPAFLPPGVSAGEFRIVGHPPSLEAALAAVHAAAALAGDGPITGFSLADLPGIDGEESLPAACRALHAAGLEALASVPLDLLGDPTEAINAARGEGLQVTRLTVHELSTADRLDVIVRARDLQEALGGFRVFAPLPQTMSVAAPSTGYDDVKLVALARLVADNIDSVQVDWARYGPKLAQFALTIGADDVDGIAAIDPGVLGTRRSPIEEIRGNIRSAFLEPAERNARYEVIG
jgi:CofH/MqnC C-terminal region